jgi:alpha-L-fucosidase
MKIFWIIVLLGSILLNVIAVWGFFTYVKYGGSPLGDLKRMLTGTTRQASPRVPYEDENQALMAETHDPDRVVFFGASITQRWDFDANLGEYPIVNRGVGGQLVPGLLTRFKRDVLDLSPKAVIIKFCSINIRPHQPLSVLRDGMTMMSDLANHKGIIPIVATIIPAGKPEARIGDFSVVDSLRQFNEWVRDFADERNYALVDFAAAIETEEGYLPFDCSIDPVHLNQRGYDDLEATLKPVLDSVLARD